MTVGGRERGVVKWFGQDKGYGFITRLGVGGDVFVHYSDVAAAADGRVLAAGWVVEFDVGPGKDGKRPQAKEVIVIDRTSDEAEAPTTWTADERRRLAHHLREALAIVEGKAGAGISGSS